ncbi:MAG: winged helix-turn-helix domain-containing protein [Paeniglutamicibacter terrestris]|jgi:DNA-binding winged helix-turn-helix (wHTH) protein|uniref:Winged helix-turn-helix transcriptional regulator n=1 Tax=Paeniglutamicibacter terrestris TaxID=2723403 RepID=A0ABX1GAX0_9MICC|nr:MULTISPECIES: winged helix-turn-helix domain-containing protein [Paeniglutamicibacter]ASN40567.1 transcriptional regulator [Arthrobacter sp. 7749]NKG22655.1 winged helix-turn-helix transcriptional regulator [Paeniglutamicibacter terrestris]QXQ10712.1 winged helix-turn-helix domain-containing protein [Paeniglutamicibacter sp. Y32M11]
MSVTSGYVHVSIRNAQSRAAAAQRTTAPGGFTPAGYRQLHAVPAATETRPMTAPTPVVVPNGTPGPQPVTGDTTARGFVLYVGLDETVAQAQGTSLGKLATQVRAFLATLSPEAQTHAAVALAPASATGDNIDVVRQALGDPTVNRRPRVDSRPAAPRPSGVLIDLSRREVHLDGETLNLTFKEFELLNYLVENGTRTVGRDELLTNLWRNAEEVPNERTIDVHIRRLRSKLGRLANTVRTVRGQGYRFYEHPEVVVWAAPEYTI